MALVIGIATIAILGWVRQNLLLASIRSDWIPMAPGTAVFFFLFGIAGFLQAKNTVGDGARRTGMFVGFLGAAGGLLFFYLSFTGIHSAYEHPGLNLNKMVNGIPVGYMSPATALGFLLASISLLSIFRFYFEGQRPGMVSTGYAIALFVAGSVFSIAYLLDSPFFYGGKFIPPALTTSISFALLGTGLLTLTIYRGFEKDHYFNSAHWHETLPFIVAFIFAALVVIAVSGLHYQSVAGDKRAEVEREISAIADLKVANLVQWRKERLADALVLQGNRVFGSLLQRALQDSRDGHAWKRVKDWLQLIRSNYDYKDFAIFDKSGVLRFSTTDVPPTGDEILRARLAMSSGHISLSNLYRSQPEGTPRMALMVPIHDPEFAGRPLGVVMLTIDATSYLYPLLEWWPGPNATAETLLVRREADRVLFLNPLRFRKNSALLFWLPLDNTDLPAAQAVRGANGIVEGRDYRKRQVIAAVRPVPGTSWYLVARIEKQEFQNYLKESLWLMSALIGALLLALGSWLGFFWRHEHLSLYKERYLAAEALAAQAARYRAVAESAVDAIVTIDHTDKIVDWNMAAEQMFGYSPSQAHGLPVEQLISPRYRDRYKYNQDHEQKEGSQQSLENQIEPYGLTRDGRGFPVEFTLSQWQVKEGKYYSFIIRDITDRQRGELAIKKNKEQLSEALDIARIGYWEYEFSTGDFIFNDQYYSLHRITAEEAGGYRMSAGDFSSRYVHPEDAIMIGQNIQLAFESPDPDYSTRIETRILTGKGEIVWVDVRFKIQKNVEGKTIRLSGINQDITDRKRKEAILAKQLEELHRWHESTLGREERILELKHETNQLLKQMGQPPRYPSAESPYTKEL